MLIGTKLNKVQYDAMDYDKIAWEVRSAGKEELENKLHSLLGILIAKIYDGERVLYRYLDIEVPNLQTELRNGTDHNSLCNIF